MNRRVTQADLEELREGLTVGWVYSEPVMDEEWGGYMYKELTKEIGRGGRGRERQWASFGADYEGKCREADIEIKDSYLECLQLAWAMRVLRCEGGQSREQVRESAMWLYLRYVEGNFRLYDRELRANECRWYEYHWEVPARWLPTRGDAWEPRGGSVDFDPSELAA